MPDVEADGLRVSDVSALAWAGVALAVAFIAWALREAATGSEVVPNLSVAGAVAFFTLWALYETATAEYDDRCAACGSPIYVHSARDGVDHVVRVQATGTPRRASAGPLSMVLSRRKREVDYCSTECAAHDLNAPGLPVPDEAATAAGEVEARA